MAASRAGRRSLPRGPAPAPPQRGAAAESSRGRCGAVRAAGVWGVGPLCVPAAGSRERSRAGPGVRRRCSPGLPGRASGQEQTPREGSWLSSAAPRVGAGMLVGLGLFLARLGRWCFVLILHSCG